MSDFFRYPATLETTRCLADSMEQQGFACLTDCLSENDLEQLRLCVSGAGLDPTGRRATPSPSGRHGRGGRERRGTGSD